MKKEIKNAFRNLDNAVILPLNLNLPALKIGHIGRNSAKDAIGMTPERVDNSLIYPTNQSQLSPTTNLYSNSGADFVLEQPKAIFTVMVNRLGDPIKPLLSDLPFVLFHKSSSDADFIDTLNQASGISVSVTKVDGRLRFSYSNANAEKTVIEVFMQSTPYLSMLSSMGARNFRLAGIKCNFKNALKQIDKTLEFTKAGFFSNGAVDTLTPVEYDRRDTVNEGIIEIPLLKELNTFEGIRSMCSGDDGQFSFTFYISSYEV